MKRTRRNSKAYSLIEVVVVVVVLAIIGAVVIPVFGTMQQNAKSAAVKGALGEMRAAILAYSAAEIAAGRASRFASGTAGGWPTLAQVNETGIDTGSLVAPKGDVPENPHARSVYSSNFDGAIDNISAGGSGVRGSGPYTGGTAAGWYYNAATGDIWARTNVNGEGSF